MTPLWTQLNLSPAACRRVCLVGGGGKTTTLYRLAREALDLGERGVVVTTTTRMYPHPRLPMAANLSGWDGAGVLFLGREAEKGKVTGPSPLPPWAGLMLLEADGARGLPLKAPAPHEPAIPPEGDAVIALAGLDALGRPICRTCHRPEETAALLGTGPDHLVTAADVASLLASPLGGRKGVPPGAAFRVVLNKGDTPARRRAGAEILSLLAPLGIMGAITSYTEKERGGLCWF